MDGSSSTSTQAEASSHAPMARRRRRCLALATAAAVLSSSGASAFSPSASAPLTSCNGRSPPAGNRSKSRERVPQRRSPRVLNMVSFLEAPADTSNASREHRRGASRGGAARVRKGPAVRGRAVEIDLRLDYDLLDMGEVVADTNSRDGDDDKRPVPEIDSEILYEGFTSALQPGLDESEMAHIEIHNDRKVDYSQFNKASIAPNETVTKSTSGIGPAAEAKRSKSSTMPGFIKDGDLDLHIANMDLRRIPSTERKLTRMVRSKAAKLKRRQTNSEMLYRKSASVPDSLLDYAQEIHAVSRVTPKEEKELGTKTQEAIRLQKLHDDLSAKYGREPSDDEWCAAAGKVNMLALQEAIEDGMRAKNRLVASNLRMVQRVVNLYIRNGLGSEYNAGDLMQDGTMALIRAAEKYEPDRGFRFSTYAMYWIRSAVKRSQTSQSRIVVVPQRIHETHKRVAKHDARLRKELGRRPTKSELAEACDISVTQLDRCRAAMSQVTFSLDAELENTHKPNGGGSARRDTMYDVVEGRVDETEYERAQRLLMKEHLIGTLRRYLSPHEVDLLLLRYGLMDDRALPRGMSGPLTIAEVSKLVGLKPDKVRRIIINSQKQLKHLMKEWEDFEYELA